jgi:predicted DNA-binding protein
MRGDGLEILASFASRQRYDIMAVLMNRLVTFTIKEETKKQIDRLAHLAGKQREAVLRELVETGLKSYKVTTTQSAKAVLDLITWAEQEQVTSKAKDLSTNHTTYAWDK